MIGIGIPLRLQKQLIDDGIKVYIQIYKSGTNDWLDGLYETNDWLDHINHCEFKEILINNLISIDFGGTEYSN